MKHPSRFAFGSFVLSGLLGLALLIPGPASATPTTFNVSGNAMSAPEAPPGIPGFCYSQTCPFSGTLGIDTTSGTVTGTDITFPGLPAFDSLGGSSSFESGWSITGINGVNAYILNFLTPQAPDSLVGFTGGGLNGGIVFQPQSGSPYYSVTSGSITTASVAVPEPDSLGMMLLGLGLLGTLVLFTKRSRVRSRSLRATGAR